MLKMSEVKTWDAKQLDTKVNELKRKLFDLRMQKNAAGIEKPHLFKEFKKDIARLETAKSQLAK